MLSSQAILAHFKPLDGLIRVIEQKDKHGNLVQFVVLSAVDDLNWTVHVGWIDVRNQSGRWWHGRWSENEIRAKVVRRPVIFVLPYQTRPSGQGTDVRDLVLGVFVRNLVSAFVEGDMRVEDWSRKKGADISVSVDSAVPNTMVPDRSRVSPLTLAGHHCTPTDDHWHVHGRRNRLYSDRGTSTGRRRGTRNESFPTGEALCGSVVVACPRPTLWRLLGPTHSHPNLDIPGGSLRL